MFNENVSFVKHVFVSLRHFAQVFLTFAKHDCAKKRKERLFFFDEMQAKKTSRLYLKWGVEKFVALRIGEYARRNGSMQKGQRGPL